MGAFETAKWDTNETQNKACKEIIKVKLYFKFFFC